MKKFKKAMALSLALAMGLSLVACGGSKTEETEAPTEAETEATTEEVEGMDPADDSTDEDAQSETSSEVTLDGSGEVINIYVWNKEFAQRMQAHLPGYEAVSDDPEAALDGGTYNGVKVVFNQVDNADNKYQDNLDAALLSQADADANDKVDIFLVEADYAKKYVEQQDYVLDVNKDLGITDDELSKQYDYTKQVMTDTNGNLRGVSWQACSAGLIYNRKIAEEVLGSQDPDDVQAAVSDWNKWFETADKVKEAGYYMTGTVNTTMRVYSNNSAQNFVVDGKVAVPDDIKKWVDDSKKLIDAGESTAQGLWDGDVVTKGFMKDPGNVFCYFGPAWYFNFCLSADDPASIAADGGWGFVVGPQSYYWGGTWICAAAGSDNTEQVAQIMRDMTTNDDVMKEILTSDADCVNNKNVLSEMANSDDGNIALLGGQNPWAILSEGAENVDASNLTQYDQATVESFQSSMKSFFDGESSYDDAVSEWTKSVIEKYPELSE